MSRVRSYFGLRDAKPEVVRLATIYTSLSLFMQIAFVISTTFYLIFVAEALGNNNFLVGMTFVGILVIVILIFIISFIQEQAMDLLLWVMGWGPYVTILSIIIIIQGVTLIIEEPEVDGILGLLPG